MFSASNADIGVMLGHARKLKKGTSATSAWRKRMTIETTAKFFKVREIHDERFYKKTPIKNFWNSQDEVNKLLIVTLAGVAAYVLIRVLR